MVCQRQTCRALPVCTQPSCQKWRPVPDLLVTASHLPPWQEGSGRLGGGWVGGDLAAHAQRNQNSPPEDLCPSHRSVLLAPSRALQPPNRSWTTPVRRSSLHCTLCLCLPMQSSLQPLTSPDPPSAAPQVPHTAPSQRLPMLLAAE